MTSLRKLLFQHPAHFCSLGFGSGLSPIAPGTFGSLVAVPLVYSLWLLPFPIALAIVIAGFFFGIWCTNLTADAMDVKDPGAIVWDEIIGMLTAALPLFFFGDLELNFLGYLYCLLSVFVFFRIFDIAKPFPISWADRTFEGGLGIMLDDLLAGVLAGLCFTIVLFFL